jgi:hypothetical protein
MIVVGASCRALGRTTGFVNGQVNGVANWRVADRLSTGIIVPDAELALAWR